MRRSPSIPLGHATREAVAKAFSSHVPTEWDGFAMWVKAALDTVFNTFSAEVTEALASQNPKKRWRLRRKRMRQQGEQGAEEREEEAEEAGRGAAERSSSGKNQKQDEVGAVEDLLEEKVIVEVGDDRRY